MYQPEELSYMGLKGRPRVEEIETISGPVSYTKHTIRNLEGEIVKVFEIFGDRHFDIKGNCKDQGILCYTVEEHSKDPVEERCVDIQTYLGYAVLDAREKNVYTDIFLETSIDPSRRDLFRRRNQELGFIARSEDFLAKCLYQEDRECSDDPDNGKRPLARVHAGDPRFYEDLDLSSFYFKNMRDTYIEFLIYLYSKKGEFYRIFTLDIEGTSIRRKLTDLFKDFYRAKYQEMTGKPSSSVSPKEVGNFVKTYLPFIDNFSKSYGTVGKVSSPKRPGEIITRMGDIPVHRIQKQFVKIRADLEEGNMDPISSSLSRFYLDFFNTVPKDEFERDQGAIIDLYLIKEGIMQGEDVEAKIINIVINFFSKLYDMYTIGRALKYPETERIISFSGDAHAKIFRRFLDEFQKHSRNTINMTTKRSVASGRCVMIL